MLSCDFHFSHGERKQIFKGRKNFYEFMLIGKMLHGFRMAWGLYKNVACFIL